MANCLNCGNQITENFCSNCGQKKYKRIDKKYIWDELQYTVFHTNKGLLYSIKTTLKNPGKTAKDFIEGNRVNHYKPILLVFVLSGIATFLTFKVLNFKEIIANFFSQLKISSNLSTDMVSIMASYNALLMLLLIPVFALFTKIAFRKWGHNYYEHVVMNAYILTFYTLITIIFVYPVQFFFRHSPSTFFGITQATMLLIPIILVWFFKEVYDDKPLKSIITRVFGIMGLTILGYIILSIFIVVLIFVYASINGPEVLQYVNTQK